MQNQDAATQIQIETQGVIPMVTLLIVFAMVTTFAMSSGHRLEVWFTNTAAEAWYKNSAAVQSINVMQWIHDQNWQRLASQLCLAALASLTGWMLFLNCYFTWFFGSTVEQRLGAPRFLMLCVLAMLIPYGIIAWDAYKHVDGTYYIGPLYLITALMGAGMVFPEEKKVNFWFKKTRGEIFTRAPSKDPTKKFKVNTKLCSMVFVAFEAGAWFFCTKYMPDFNTFHIMGVAAGGILGYGLAWFLVWSATGDLREGPVKLMCIRKYNDVLKLDVGHDAAVRTTSMALGLPEDRVRQWVAKQKGKMKIS